MSTPGPSEKPNATASSAGDPKKVPNTPGTTPGRGPGSMNRDDLDDVRMQLQFTDGGRRKKTSRRKRTSRKKRKTVSTRRRRKSRACKQTKSRRRRRRSRGRRR